MIKERKKRGNHPVGINNGKSKLNCDDVREIKRRINDGESRASIARYFNVSFTAIQYIYIGKTWNHVV